MPAAAAASKLRARLSVPESRPADETAAGAEMVDLA